MKLATPKTLLALVFLLHAVVGAVVGLSVDEAHYLLYALHPALSYFDHPPLVGWVQWPLVALNAPIVVLRLIPGLLWLFTVWGVYRLTLALHPLAHGQTMTASDRAQQAGVWAMAALLLAPLLHVLGIGLLPDTLLMALTVALMGQTLRLMDTSDVQRPAVWLLLGLLLGLAGLAKYTAIFTAAAVAVCLLWVHGWRLLRNPWLWACAALALCMVLPVLVWNAQNGWISFVYQAKHGSGSVWELRHVLRFLLLQVLSYGALLLWGLLGLSAWRTRAGGASAPRRLAVLLAFFAIPFAIFTAMAGGGSSLPHWTAPAWVALAPFAGLGLAAAGKGWLLRVVLLLQALLCALLLGWMVSAGQPLLKQPNLFADLHGWDTAGQRAKALSQQHGLSSVSVQNWTLASRIAWYARPLPVHVLQTRFDQFDLWVGDLQKEEQTLLLDWSGMAYDIPTGARGFSACRLLDTQDVVRMGVPVSQFRFFACQDWSGLPKPR